jgi:hypothetical protein
MYAAEPALAKMLGNMLEGSVHLTISNQNKECPKPSIGLLKRVTTIEFIQHEEDFVLHHMERFVDVRSIEDLQEFVYYVPQSPTFPTIDSFAVVPWEFVKKFFPV